MSEARKTFPLVLSESERQMLRDVRDGMGAESDTDAVRALIRFAHVEMGDRPLDESVALWRLRRRQAEKGREQVARESEEQHAAYEAYARSPEYARDQERDREQLAKLDEEFQKLREQVAALTASSKKKGGK